MNSRDRAGDERKDEYTRLEAVIEKHQGLIPRVLETQVKSEVSGKQIEMLESSIRGNTQVPSDVGYMVRNLIREHFGECGVSFGDTD